MASLEFVYKHRFCILLWSLLEILLFSAIVYGWAALCVVLKEDGFFNKLCEPTDEGNMSLVSENCDKFITKRLNLVFLTGVISFNATGLVSGVFLDRFGPRKTRLLSSILFGFTFLFLVLADDERPDWIFPGIFTLSAAGLTLLLPVFQVANMFEGSKSMVISIFNGAVDSSSVVLLFSKLVYEAGVPLYVIVIVYFLFAIASILMLTFILPPHSITLQRLRDIPQYSKTDKGDEGSPLFEPEDGTIKSPYGESDSVPGVLSQMLTLEYIFAVLVLSGHSLRLWFYVGNLNSYLEFMSDNDEDTVSYYTNWFGVYQFTGIITAPFVGLPMDWKPKTKQDEETDMGFIAGYVLTSFVAFTLNILVLLPVLPVQYVTFIVEVVLRSFNYAVFTAFLIHKFPLIHFGKLYGLGHLVSSIIGCLQYALFTIVEDDLKKDPFWVNVGLLFTCLFLNIQPVYLWIKEKRQERERLRIALIQG